MAIASAPMSSSLLRVAAPLLLVSGAPLVVRQHAPPNQPSFATPSATTAASAASTAPPSTGPLPTDFTIVANGIGPEGNLHRGECLTVAVAPNAAMQCSGLRITHALPSITTMGKTRTPTLIYTSQTGGVSMRVPINVTVPSTTPVVRIGVVPYVTGGGQGHDIPTGTANATWTPAMRDGRPKRIIVAMMNLGLPTGVYHYRLNATAVLTNNQLTSRSDTGTLAYVNRISSPFGTGWWLDGLEQLLPVVEDPRLMLWVGGDGSTTVYARSPIDSMTLLATASLSGPDTLRQLAGSIRWQRRLRNGAYTAFDPLGRHVMTVNGAGDTTKFVYDPANPLLLQSIEVPVPGGTRAAYTFTYSAATESEPPRLLRVDALPVNGQARRWLRDATPDGHMTFTDPDGSVVTFWSNGQGIEWRQDQLGHSVQFGMANNQLQTVRSWTGTLRPYVAKPTDENVLRMFCPAELQPTAACGGTVVDTGNVATVVYGVRPDGSDWTRFGLTRYGAPSTITNALSQTTKLERGDTRFPMLVTAVVHPNGFVQRATYTSRGLDSTRSDIEPLGSGSGTATTRYVWSTSRFDVLDSIIGPTGALLAFGHDARGNRVWQQDGRGVTTRAAFSYNANNQVVTVAKPGNDPTTQVDSIIYEPTLGNVARTRTPSLAATSYHTDAIGRVDATYSPIDGTHTRVTTDSFDLMDRVVLHRESASSIPFALGGAFLGGGFADSARAATINVAHHYDAVGNETSLERWSTPNPTNIPLAITSWTYDAFGRKTNEYPADGGHKQWFYDAAGNDTLAITSRNNRILTTYDALNRPIRRISEAASYAGPRDGEVFLPGHAPIAAARFPAFIGDFVYDFKNPSAAPPALGIPGDTATFAYDVTGGIASAVNSTAVIARTYFPNGQLKSDVMNLDGQPYIMRYQPGLDGQLLTRTDDLPGCPMGGCVQQFGYDPASGQLASTWEVDKGARVYFEDDPANRRRVQRSMNAAGVERTAVYDYYTIDGGLASRVRTENGVAVSSDAIGYDQAGRIATALSEYPGNPQRNLWTENAYNGLDALAGTFKNRQGISVGDLYVTDAFGNAAEHHSHNFTNSAAWIVDRFGYDGERQTSAFKSTAQFHPPQNPPSNVLDQTQSIFDVAGNRVHTQRLVAVLDPSLLGSSILPPDGAWVQTLPGTEWTWNAYDAEDRLRVAQRSYWATDDQQRTVFIEYSYDALGRKVKTHTRWDLHCGVQVVEDCMPSIERTIWDGNQVRMELRASAVDSTVISTGEPPHICMPDSDWNSNPWCNSDGTTRWGERIVTYQDASAGLYTSGNFTGIVRYTQAGGLDDPLVVYRDEFPDGLVPYRSWRGLHEDGTFLTSPSIGIAWPARDLDAFGARDVRVAPGQAQPTVWLGSLIGDRKDPGGLVYMRNRFYDPQTGRFTQQDPIGLAGGMNLYGFASGDPVNFSDPLGLFACPPNCPDNSDGLGWARFAGAMLRPAQTPMEIAGMVVTAPLAGDMGMMGKVMSWLGVGSRAASGTARVLGHYPDYLQVGDAIGAKTFSIPTRVWDSMSETERWAANQKFLDRGIASSAEFIMATPRLNIRAGSATATEISYLLKNGYKWAGNNMSLIPK